MSDVAIVGGGFLGSALAHALPPPVHVATRSGRLRADRGSSGISVAALDIVRDPMERIASALHDARALVIAVAPGRDQDRRTVYVEGTRRLLEATRDIPWRRIVHIGSTSALPDRDAWLDETCDDPPDSERGLVQREAEAIVREHAETLGLPWLVLRLGGLYGPSRPIGQLHRRTRDNAPGDGNVASNLIHVDDAVQAVLAALAAPPLLTGIVHVCADDHTPYRALYRRVGADLRWEREPVLGAPPAGKRVSNLRMKALLRVRLLHPVPR